MNKKEYKNAKKQIKIYNELVNDSNKNIESLQNKINKEKELQIKYKEIINSNKKIQYEYELIHTISKDKEFPPYYISVSIDFKQVQDRYIQLSCDLYINKIKIDSNDVLKLLKCDWYNANKNDYIGTGFNIITKMDEPDIEYKCIIGVK